MEKSKNYPYDLARIVEGTRYHVVYKVYSTQSGKLVRKRKYFDHIKNIDERRLAATDFLNKTNELLTTGNAHLKIEKSKTVEKIKLISIAKAFDDALARKKTLLRQRTIESYEITIKNFLARLEDTKASIKKISQNDAREYSNYLLIEKKVSIRTHNSYIWHLMALCTEMEKSFGYIDENPFKSVNMPKPKVTMRNRALFDHERKRLLISIDCDALRLACELQYYCFLRPNELRQLQIRDIDLKHFRINLFSQISKNGTHRVIEIPNAFKERILSLGLDKKPQKLYLVGFRDTAYSKHAMYDRHKKILLRLGIDKEVTFYSWKHTGVVMAHRSGVDIYSVYRQGGWKDWKSFENYLKSLGLYSNAEIITKMPMITI